MKRGAFKALDHKERVLVTRTLQAFVQGLRAILKRVGPHYYKQYPTAGRPCQTCAFNPSTDRWQGAESTAMTLAESIKADRPFYCHDGIPWDKPIEVWTAAERADFIRNRKLCAGYAVVTSTIGGANRQAKAAFAKAALTTVIEIYEGSSGDATKELFGALMLPGAAGELAVNLFRAQKASARAKVYRGGRRGFKGVAYDKKGWAIGNISELLTQHGAALGMRWGWQPDPATEGYPWVLYVDLPTGQVS